MAEKTGVIVLPHQLFAEHPLLDGTDEVFLLEHEQFFCDFKFHKKKLVLHRASLKAWEKEQAGKGRCIHYIPFAKSSAERFASLLKRHRISHIQTTDPHDVHLDQWLTKTARKASAKLTITETPQFMTPSADIDALFAGKKHFQMAPFYTRQRRAFNILMEARKPIGGKWSFDVENRKSLPKDISIPNLPSLRPNEFVTEAQQYVARHFADNPGDIEEFDYPVTHDQVRRWLTDFLENRLADFGPYEDAISSQHTFLFHSVLTPALNTGLITPEGVVRRSLAFHAKHSIGLASIEGFIRQIIGWREFMHGVYRSIGDEQRTANFWGFHQSIPPAFYDGTTGIEPVDTVIGRVLKHAYCHHIERLMVLGNFMLLCEIDPNAVYRWFMELFIDAYDWVMVPNVYGMSQYADGGRITTKPYVSSSNYVRKMSDFQSGPWCDIWDGLFWRFIGRHKKTLAKNPRMRMMTAQLRRMGKQKLRNHRKTADAFLERLF